jgi:uncharacterized protein
VVFGRIARIVAGRPLLVLAVVAVLALGGAVLALQLKPSTATETLVSPSSETFKQTERSARDFGGDAVLVLVEGKLSNTLLTEDLGRLLNLEGCLGGNGQLKALRRQLRLNRKDPSTGLPPVCAELARLRPAKAVYGPATFINTAVTKVQQELVSRSQQNDRAVKAAAVAARKKSAARGDLPEEQERLAKAAGDAVNARFIQTLAALALQYNITAPPTLGDASFISTLVFTTQPGEPKSRFAYLFPSKNAALVQVRLRPGLTDGQRRHAIDLIEQAVAAPAFAPTQGGRYVVTGVPVVANALADTVQSAIVVLLGAALLLMGATLALVFRSRLRLLPLALALGAAALTFGVLALVGGDLTMASIASLPVLIGLAVDYAIQFQARYDEELVRLRGRVRPRTAAEGSPPAGATAQATERSTVDDQPATPTDRELRRDAAVAAASSGGPTIATAGLATAVGFLVLLLSPVPMVRGFGVLLVLGIALALACTLCAGVAALVRFGGPRRTEVPPLLPRARARLRDLADHPRVLDAREWVAGRAWRTLGVSLTRPRRVLAVGLALAVLGIALDTQSEVVSDVNQLVPQNLQALKDVSLLQRETGVAGEIDVTVRADDITKPAVIAWMTRLQQGVLRAHGYRAGKRCTQTRNPPELCPALSLPDLFPAAARGQARALLDAVPAYFSQGVVTRDRKTANLAFGIRLMPLSRQNEVVDDIQRRLHPPPGVQASVVGLPVLFAEANGALSSPWRRGLTLLAALAAVFLVLLIVRRSLRDAAVPLIPIALATGWSAGLLFVLGLLPGPFEVDLNPMSATLGALVIAISTEFSVLLSSRYRQERDAGAGPARAIELAYASTGAAVLASGATAIAGFGALIASDIRMLRDFGIVTVVDLTLSLLGVMVVLPAALMWAEQRGRLRVSDLDPRRLLRRLRSESRPSLPPSRRDRAEA